MAFQFKFKTFNEWYKHNLNDTNLFEVDDTVQAWNINQSNDWMKYSKKEQREKFLVVQRVSSIRKIKDISETYKEQYKNGMYVITDYAPNWILFVFPTAKVDDLIKYPGPFADHYSFVHNPRGSKGRVNQFHETIYIPRRDLSNKDGSNGRRTDSKDQLWFKEGQLIPIRGYETDFMSRLGGTAQRAVIDMLRAPWTAAADMSGGTKRSAVGAPTRETKRSRTRLTQTSSRFLEKWREYKIDRAFAFSVKVGDTHYVTVSIYDKANEPEYVERLAFRFTMKRLDSRTVKKKLIEYVESLS